MEKKKSGYDSMKFSSPRTIRRIEVRTKERRLWRTISTINGRNRGIYSPRRKFWPRNIQTRITMKLQEHSALPEKWDGGR